MQLPVSHTHLPPFFAILNAPPKLNMNPSGCFFSRHLFSNLKVSIMANGHVANRMKIATGSALVGSVLMSSGIRNENTAQSTIQNAMKTIISVFSFLTALLTAPSTMRIIVRTHASSMKNCMRFNSSWSMSMPPHSILVTNATHPIMQNTHINTVLFISRPPSLRRLSP